jgi:hypothetical protein
VVHRTVSGAPGSSALNSSTSGFSRSRRAKNHRTVRCTPDSVRCAKGSAALELASLGFSRRPRRYNSPDMSGVHRTVRCIHGATASSAPTALCRAFNARRWQACPYWHTGQGTVAVRCAPDTQEGPHVRSFNGRIQRH